MDGFPYSYYIFKDALAIVRTFLSGTYFLQATAIRIVTPIGSKKKTPF
jgi:hypothetical protein